MEASGGVVVSKSSGHLWRRFPCSRGPVRSRNCRQIEVWDTLHPHPSPPSAPGHRSGTARSQKSQKSAPKTKKNREQNTFSGNFEKIEKSHFRSPEVGFGWIWGGILVIFADLTVCPSRPERCRQPPRAATATASGAAGRGVGWLRGSGAVKYVPGTCQRRPGGSGRA